MFPFCHIDLRVPDVEAIYPFYARILPELGFPHEWRGEDAFSFQTEGKLPKLSWFGVMQDRDHVPNATRFAFAVESREEVDRLEGPQDHTRRFTMQCTLKILAAIGSKSITSKSNLVQKGPNKADTMTSFISSNERTVRQATWNWSPHA